MLENENNQKREEFFAKHLLRETRQKISRFIPLIGSRAPNVALPLLFIPALISLVRIGSGFLAIFGCLLFMTGRWALSHQTVPTWWAYPKVYEFRRLIFIASTSE